MARRERNWLIWMKKTLRRSRRIARKRGRLRTIGSEGNVHRWRPWRSGAVMVFEVHGGGKPRLGIASPTSAREGRLRPPLFIKGGVAVSTAVCPNLLQYLHEQVFDFVRPYSGDGAEVGFLATILACLNFAARKYGETDRP